jgi:hypothetical protein
MEILPENLLELISEHCSSHWELKVYKDHLIINLPDTQEDYRSVYLQVKKEIAGCVQQHFPERATELRFEVRNGSWNASFKIGKAP